MGKKIATGGVLIDENVASSVANQRTISTSTSGPSPKDGSIRGEDLQSAALREVKEEAGYDAEIIGEIDGVFEGGASVTYYFLMRPKGVQGPFDRETASTRWVNFEEAKRLIKKTTNATGCDRDLKVLLAAKGRR